MFTFPKPTIHSMPRVSITIPGKNSQPYRFKLDREKVTIGRSSDNDIVIDCPSVSALHCTMERVPGGYILRDRKSTNGIRLDEEYMATVDLRNDANVRVGDVQFGYTLSDDELDELDEEEFVPLQETSEERAERKEKTASSDEKPAKKKAKANIVTTPQRPATPVTPQVLASSSESGGFLYGLSLFIAGILALYAGLSSSYSGQQTKAGRQGEFSLLGDIKDGRPPLETAEEKNADSE
jgi:pSer/pThr/pTyr-binding forkhead associated (FHA) protein